MAPLLLLLSDEDLRGAIVVGLLLHYAALDVTSQKRGTGTGPILRKANVLDSLGRSQSPFFEKLPQYETARPAQGLSIRPN